MQWWSNGYRGESQTLEGDRKLEVNLWEWTGKGQAFKIDEQKTKHKAKTKRHSNRSIWNFWHNNRLQFQTSCFAGSIRGCSNAKGEIIVKLTNVRRCRQTFFTLVVVNYQRKGTKGQPMIYNTFHRKQLIEQHVYFHPRENGSVTIIRQPAGPTAR